MEFGMQALLYNITKLSWLDRYIHDEIHSYMYILFFHSALVFQRKWQVEEPFWGTVSLPAVCLHLALTLCTRF